MFRFEATLIRRWGKKRIRVRANFVQAATIAAAARCPGWHVVDVRRLRGGNS